MAEKPTAAFVLVLIGGIIVLIGALLSVGALLVTMSASNAAASLASAYGGYYNSSAVNGALYLGIGLALASLVAGVLMIISSIKLNSTNVAVVKKWSIVALVFTLVSLTTLGGFVIGFILGLIGSILGLTYKG